MDGAQKVSAWRYAGALVLSHMLLAIHCEALAAPPVTVFREADFYWSGQTWIIPSDATWQHVTLPHKWTVTNPGAIGYGWYRIQFDLETIPPWVAAIALDSARCDAVDFYVNGTGIGSSTDVAPRVGRGIGLNTPVYLTFPTTLLKLGENVILARMYTHHAVLNLQGLGRVTFGDAHSVRKQFVAVEEWGFYAERSLIAMTFAAGIISVFVWLAQRRDRVLLWYAIACLSWVTAGVLWNALRWTHLPGKMIDVQYALIVYWSYGLVVPAVILAMRMAGIRRPLFEAALWLFLLAEFVAPMAEFPTWEQYSLTTKYMMVRLLAQDAINGVLLASGAGIIVTAVWRRRRWPDIVAAGSLGAMAALMFYEAARYLGWVDIEAPVLRPYHVPLLVFAIGAAIFDRHVRAVWRMQRSNVELQRRVDEKAREIEAYHAERESRLRQEALIRDRQRILADMHDGLGASLVGLLRYAQSGAANARGLEARVTEALQELRIAVDALEPAEGDLGTVLGKLRHRIAPLVEAGGMRLTWDAEELPPMETLDSSAVFAIQRVVLEAVSNAIQHAGAGEIRISSRAEGADSVAITVQDDGRGYDSRKPSTGLGLGNMRRRAESLGGSLDIAPAPGGGTRVTLRVPVNLGRSAPTAFPEVAIGSRA
jgi:signal transduction histidine kinase